MSFLDFFARYNKTGKPGNEKFLHQISTSGNTWKRINIRVRVRVVETFPRLGSVSVSGARSSLHVIGTGLYQGQAEATGNHQIAKAEATGSHQVAITKTDGYGKLKC